AETEAPTSAPYLKFEKHEVEHFGSLPVEVEELMHSADKLPLVCLIPSAEGSKPGLMACTPKGEFRYWEDISYAMTEAERYKGLKLYLQEEHVALYRIHVCQPDGKPTLISSSISRPGGFIGQLSSYLWQSGKLDDGGIVSTTLGAKLGKNYSSELFVLLEKSLEKWVLSGTRIAPKDIHEIIAQEVYISDGVFESNPLDVQILDIEFAKNGELVILVSRPTGSRRSDQNKDLTYFLVILNTVDQESTSGQYSVTKCHPLKVQSVASLVMPNGGPGAFVIFPQAIIVTTILKDTIDNISEMRILTTKTGVMSCRLNISEIIEENAPLQSQEDMDIEDSQVPVSCTLSSDFKGDINKVALELSDEILDSITINMDGAEGPCRKLLNSAIYGYFQDRNFQSQNEDLARNIYYQFIVQPELLKVIHQQFEETDVAIRNFTVQHSSQTVNDSLQYTSQGINDYNKIQMKDARIETLKDQMSYEDYKTLVDLIMESGENINDHITIYMEKYQEKFAFKLYEWYIEKGIENGFELIDAYTALQDQFVEIITSTDQTVDESKQVDVIVDNAAKNLKQYRPMHAKLYYNIFDTFLNFYRWDSISNTNDMSDEDLNEQIRGTAVYHTLDIVSQTADIPLIQWFCPPAEAFFASTEEQLRRRFPDFNEEELAGLIEDYKRENTALERVIKDYNLVMHVEHALRLLDLKSALD
ncbi:18718_t:CDS:10, partial [Racocetra fulgida]